MMEKDNLFNSTDERLEEALALLAAGMPLADVLAEAGNDAAWLRPLIEVAADVGQLRSAVAVPAPTASLTRLLAYGKTLAVETEPAEPVRRAGPGQFFRTWGQPRLGFSLAAVSLAVSLLIAFLAGSVVGGSLAMAAHDSLPGQSLYAFKRAGETVNLAIVQDPAERRRLADTYNERRRVEAEQLLEVGRQVAVVFESRVEAMSGSAFHAHGLVVRLTPQTIIAGTLAPGARIRLEAVTEPPAALVATRITVLEPAPPSPTPTLTPSPRPSSTPLPTPTTPATATPVRSQTTDTLVLPTVTDAPPPPPPPSPSDRGDDEPADDKGSNSGPGNADERGENENDNENTNEGAGDGGNDNDGNDNTSSGPGGDNGGDNSNDNTGADSSGSDDSDNSGSGSDSSGDRGGDSGGGDDDSGDDDND